MLTFLHVQETVIHQGNLDQMTKKLFFQNMLGQAFVTWLKLITGRTSYRGIFDFQTGNWTSLSHFLPRCDQRGSRRAPGVQTECAREFLLTAYNVCYLEQFSCYEKHWYQMKSGLKGGFREQRSNVSHAEVFESFDTAIL